MHILSFVDFTVLAYVLGLYAVIVVSPGPGFALVSRLALRGERSKCGGAIVGLALAGTFYALLAMIGLAAVLSQIGWLARVVQIAGGLYLVYLGLSAWRNSGQPIEMQVGKTDPGRSFAQGIRTGMIVNLSNPKAITFFVSLYAAVVPADAHWATRVFILIAGLLIELLWYWIVGRTLTFTVFQSAYRASARWIERILGSLLVAFGSRLILSRSE